MGLLWSIFLLLELHPASSQLCCKLSHVATFCTAAGVFAVVVRVFLLCWANWYVKAVAVTADVTADAIVSHNTSYLAVVGCVSTQHCV